VTSGSSATDDVGDIAVPSLFSTINKSFLLLFFKKGVLAYFLFNGLTLRGSYRAALAHDGI
jgi:hypothetical protein